ncbi:folliculin-interacting protein 2-like [Rhincodon typus]|uniref:folliculin-interacting protein 2-like n=1 Tax=Rhincodon typus TaxID=259920 RepID=UPI00202FF392|nr:folliculin-interacting protein 2-like [Rhincodon typus]
MKHSHFSWTPVEFEVDQIRLIVYQDCERRGRHVLFDSKAVRKVEGASVQKGSDDVSTLQGKCHHTGSSSTCTQNLSSSIAVKEQLPRYQYSRPVSDVNMLGEMMFGSVAMSYKGSTLKIHHIRSPPQLMISKVFSARMGSVGSSNMLQDSFECINQENTVGKPCPSQDGISNSRIASNLGHLLVCGSKLLLCPTEPGPLQLIRSASFFAGLCGMLSIVWTTQKHLSHFMIFKFFILTSLPNFRFFSALITAVLTYHLAWVPTVMPNDHPPIKAFHEKHASQNVDLLGKSHPYNPLWAQLGDLYGAIGSPVRLARTVVVGKRKELVERLLFVLSYFIRCSDLQENQLMCKGKLSEGENIQAGTKISTALEKGEVEESEYVVVTVHKDDPIVVTPLQSSTNVGKENMMAVDKSIQLDFTSKAVSSRKPESDSYERYTSGQYNEPPSVMNGAKFDAANTCAEITMLIQENAKETVTTVKESALCTTEIQMLGHEGFGLTDRPTHSASPTAAKLASSPPVKMSQAVSVLSGMKCPDRFPQRSPHLQDRVLFQIGCSLSPDSDIETRRQEMEEQVEQFRNHQDGKNNSNQLQKDIDLSKIDTVDQPTEAGGRMQEKQNHYCERVPFSEGNTSIFEHFTEDNGPAASKVAELSNQVSGISIAKETVKLFVCSNRENTIPNTAAIRTSCCDNLEMPPLDLVDANSGSQNYGDTASTGILCGEEDDSGKNVALRIDGDIPRNESSDSALGDSDDEDVTHDSSTQGLECFNERRDTMEELELSTASIKMSSRSTINNFGKSLFGGYCSQYVPDLVLHGTCSDEKLKQCLMADLAHAVQHPVLDEPIAESVCIIADTDKCSVQVATNQKKVMDSKLGKEVLVSNLVSSLLQSILQLYKLKIPPDYCVIHLEDRLQELYFKSKMLSEYLKGHTRVHVKELGVVLGIESNDLPLLAAIASTHSPYVAQILL